MCYRYEVYAWTLGDRLGIGIEDFYYKELYRGQSIIKMMWHAILGSRHNGLIKIEVRSGDGI